MFEIHLLTADEDISKSKAQEMNNHNIIIVTYDWIANRECARLQGFPDTFKIPVSNTQAYKQFGNSVPVKVIEKLAEQMLKHIKKDDRRSQTDASSVAHQQANAR